MYHVSESGRKPAYKCGYNSVGGVVESQTGYDVNGNYYVAWSWRNTSMGMFEDANLADKFSVSTSSGGNGQLEYPIAQITADEIAYAGGRFNNNSKSWYYYNDKGSAAAAAKWWTMSPANLNEKYGGVSNAFYVDGTSSNPGRLYDVETSVTTLGTRPVLSLKSCVKVTTGNGSSSTPYEVTIDSTCASLEN